MLHATVPSADRRPSKKSFSPRVVLSGVWGLSGGIAWRVSSAGKPIWSTDLGSANGPALGMGRCWEMAGHAVSSGVETACDCAGLLAPPRPKFSAAAAVATRSPMHKRFRLSGVILSEPPRISPDQAAGCKRAALDIGTTWVSRGSPSVSQTSLSAFASLPISVSL